MSISGVRPSLPLNRTAIASKAVAAAPATSAAPAAPVKATTAAKPVVKAQEWTLARITKTAGSAVGGFVAGGALTAVADLFLHFGNNGGTAWPGGIYLMAAGAVALGAAALYNKLSAK